MDAEITIIGAGVVGLALSEKLSGRCNNLFLIESTRLSSRKQAAETVK